MKRGFTLIELMVVVVVIGILAGIVTLGYIKYQDRAETENRKSVANLISSSVQSYKNINFEFPAAAALSAQSTSGNPPTDNYALTTSVLKVQASFLSTPSTSFVPCSGSSCSLVAANSNKIYYITKTAPVGTAQSVSSDRYGGGPNCTYNFTAASAPNQDFLIAYYDIEKSSWMMDASSSNIVPSHDFWCGMTGI